MTENGLGEYDTLTDSLEVNDDYRIEYLRAHLLQCKLVIAEGVDLIGFCAWSFTDVLSWSAAREALGAGIDPLALIGADDAGVERGRPTLRAG